MCKEKLYQCSKCGTKKTGDKIFYYVDGNNTAITRNSLPYCYKCYIETYGKGK